MRGWSGMEVFLPGEERMAETAERRVQAISWNLTKRCNQRCAHCYMSAFPGADRSAEFSRDECLGVVDQMAEVNPNAFLILTGGEPLVRHDLFDIAENASKRGFTVVLGTNGVLLDGRVAERMKASGIQGASVSLDSVDPERHDQFRGLPGGWEKAVRAMRLLEEAGLPFSLHFSAMEWNAEELPAMVDFARERGAQVLNVFFLVRTGRGEGFGELPAPRCEDALRFLARVQGVNGNGEGPGERTREGDDLLIRAKCAPHFRRVVYEADPASPLLSDYANGGCPAGREYCRIGPSGEVTPCPYVSLSAGNLRDKPFGEIWRSSSLLSHYRSGELKGRCGRCEFREVCGGCRCRAYAAKGDVMAEDPACAYEPPGDVPLVRFSEEGRFGLEVERGFPWTAEARERLSRIPSFARGMVAKSVEDYARERGVSSVTADLMKEAREALLPRSLMPGFVRDRLGGGQ